MFDSIPVGLDEMEPGVALAGFLASIDVTKVSGYDRVVVLRAEQRMAAHYAARTCASMVSVVAVMEDDDPSWAAEAAAAEIRAALRLTRRAADSDLSFALELRRRLPGVWEALLAGRIDVRRARMIVHNTGHLDDEEARTVVDSVIDEAPRLTTGQLAARLARLCMETDPERAHRRYDHAVTQRRVVLEPTVSGTANLGGWDLPPDRAAAVARRINRIARTLRTSSETRTMDQLRADVYLDLLQGNTNGATNGRAVVDIRVDLETLTRLAESPGDLAGYGPVVADIARQTTEQQPDAEWRWTVTHPATGQPIAAGATRRRPTPEQRRQVDIANPVCVFPGCRMPASGCDLDHTVAWADGGPTTPDNLAPLCRHDHRIRHHGWSHHPLPGGDHHWTTKLGHTHTTSGLPP